jgi:hypothetical protein
MSRVLLPTRGDVRTVSPLENGRYVVPTKRQSVSVKETIDSSSPEDVSDHLRLWWRV